MTFFGGGESAKIETTALATIALLSSNQRPAPGPRWRGW